MEFGSSLGKLPAWALPAGAGVLVGGVVLMSKLGNRNDSPAAPIIVGETASSTEPGMDAVITAMFDSFRTGQTELFSGFAETQANIFEQFAGSQEASDATLAAAITAQGAASNAQYEGVLAVFQDFITGQSEFIEDILERMPEPGETTQAPTIIDHLKELYKSAFDRIPKPTAGINGNVAVANSDIIQNDNENWTYFDTTGHMVSGKFREFLGNKGGAKTWGRPLSQVFKDSAGRDTQVFERVIMKWVPGSDPNNYDIVLIPLF